jgi:catechol 2,3-dioxygenase-like lactoylglutathione lyase family enzyme
MKIGIVDGFVDDQDRARDFYTAPLGWRTPPPRPAPK